MTIEKKEVPKNMTPKPVQTALEQKEAPKDLILQPKETPKAMAPKPGQQLEIKEAPKDMTPKPVDISTAKKEQLAKDLKRQREIDKEIVKGIFRFFEVPYGFMGFSYKAYAEDEIQRYDFIDGMTYSIPLGVAKHLNKTGWYPIHAFTWDSDGKPSQKIGQKVRRYGFQSLEFIDVGDYDEGKQIITVENVVP